MLWAVEQLGPEQAQALTNLEPQLRSAYDAEGTWQDIVFQQMDFPDELVTALKGLWRDHLVAAEEHDRQADATAWARHVVDSNFT